MALAPLKGDLVTAALDRTFLAESLPTTQADFARRVQEGRSRFNLIAQELQLRFLCIRVVGCCIDLRGCKVAARSQFRCIQLHEHLSFV